MLRIQPVHPIYPQLENRAGSDLPRLIPGNSLSEPRDEVIVMGYPTGMRAMLEQAGNDFLPELRQIEAV
jgi:hypothetical protein